MPTELETVLRGTPLKAQVISSSELTSFLQQMVLGSHLILGSCQAVSTLLMFLEVPVLLVALTNLEFLGFSLSGS